MDSCGGASLAQKLLRYWKTNVGNFGSAESMTGPDSPAPPPFPAVSAIHWLKIGRKLRVFSEVFEIKGNVL